MKRVFESKGCFWVTPFSAHTLEHSSMIVELTWSSHWYENRGRRDGIADLLSLNSLIMIEMGNNTLKAHGTESQSRSSC